MFSSVAAVAPVSVHATDPPHQRRAYKTDQRTPHRCCTNHRLSHCAFAAGISLNDLQACGWRRIRDIRRVRSRRWRTIGRYSNYVLQEELLKYRRSFNGQSQSPCHAFLADALLMLIEEQGIWYMCSASRCFGFECVRSMCCGQVASRPVLLYCSLSHSSPRDFSVVCRVIRRTYREQYACVATFWCTICESRINGNC